MNALTIFDLQALVEARDFTSLREETRNWPAGDLADLMEPLPAEKEAVFRLLPRRQAAQIFSYLPIERQRASQLLGYSENSVGRLMTPHFVPIRSNWTVAQALHRIRRYGTDSETMSTIYAINERGTPIDDLRIRQILLAAPETLVADLMDSRFIALKATDDQEVAVEAFREADLNAVRVTDSDGVLIGIVTVDDIFDVFDVFLVTGGR